MASSFVRSDPLAELPVKNEKYVRNCKELYMGNRGITAIDGFERFTNLEVLWLNDNKITRLKGFGENTRLKKVYLQNNKISKLSSLKHIKFLQELNLSNNNLKDLKAVLDVLCKNKYVKQLDLMGNPVAEENQYRLLVIHRMPWLEIFDSFAITAAERLKASRVVRGEKAPKREKSTFRWDQNMSGTVKMLQTEMDKLHARDAAEEAKARADMFLKENTPAIPETAPIAKGIDFASAAATRDSSQLGRWEMYTMFQMFVQLDADSSGQLDKDELRKFVESMADHGRVLSPESASDCDRILDSIDVDGDGKVSWQEFYEGMTNGCVDTRGKRIKPLRWATISLERCRERKEELFHHAQQAMVAVMRLDENDPERQVKMDEGKKLTQVANRLQALEHTILEHPQLGKKMPAPLPDKKKKKRQQLPRAAAAASPKPSSGGLSSLKSPIDFRHSYNWADHKVSPKSKARRGH